MDHGANTSEISANLAERLCWEVARRDDARVARRLYRMQQRKVDDGTNTDEITQNLAERLCWEVARRDDARVARRLYRKQLVDGVYRLDEGAVLDDFFHFLQAIGVMALLEEVHGTAIHREMLPFVQYVLLYGLKTLFWHREHECPAQPAVQ